RRDRTPFGLVVERYVPRDDGHPERLGRNRDRLDGLLELPGDLRLLGIAEVEAIGQPDRPAACARHVATRVEDRLQARLERIALAGARARQRDGEAAVRRPEPQYGRVEARSAH